MLMTFDSKYLFLHSFCTPFIFSRALPFCVLCYFEKADSSDRWWRERRHERDRSFRIMEER